MRGLFSRLEMAYPPPTKGFSWPSPDKPRHGHAVCTLSMYPPPPTVPPFMLKQNLSPKDTAEVTSQDESFIPDIAGKGLIWLHVESFLL